MDREGGRWTEGVGGDIYIERVSGWRRDVVDRLGKKENVVDSERGNGLVRDGWSKRERKAASERRKKQRGRREVEDCSKGKWGRLGRWGLGG